ncbi:MAG: sigma-70 family RNA polymerase sigma factor, partial [Planctomycetota bacterium]
AAEVPEAAQSAPDEALQRVELMRIVLEEIGRLPAAQSRAIALRYVEQRSVEQIAQIEHKQPSTIRAHISRGLAGVRESLDRRLGGRTSWSVVLAPWALDPNFLAPVEGLASGGGAATTSGAVTGTALTALTALKVALLLVPLAALAFWFAIPDDAADPASDAVADVVVGAALTEGTAERDGSELAVPDLASTSRTAQSSAGPAAADSAAPETFPLEGRVLNAAGAGARGVTVLVDPASAAPAGVPGDVAPSAYEAETGPDGAFALDVALPAGPLTVRFEDTASGLPLEAAPELVTFPFEGALETSIPPVVELRLRGARLPDGARVFAVPRQPIATRAAVSKTSDRYVRFIEPVSADARWIEFEVENSYLAASAPLDVGPDRFEDPLVVRFEARGRVRFRMDGLDPAMQAFASLSPVDADARPVIARFDEAGVGLADDLTPGAYRWSCRIGSVEQSGDVVVAARTTAEVELVALATKGSDASVLIDASAAPEADLLDGQWTALAVDANNPASGLSVELARRGAAGDGLWHAQIADLPEGDWLLGLRPRDGY